MDTIKHERTECEVCGSEEFMLSSGLFFCSECGTQSQDVREELTAKDETVTFIRTLKASTKKKAKETDKGTSVVDVTQLEKYQMVLQMQCDALIKLGFDPSVKEAVQLIWFKYLKYCGYAFQGPGSSTQPSTSTGEGSPRTLDSTTNGPSSGTSIPVRSQYKSKYLKIHQLRKESLAKRGQKKAVKKNSGSKRSRPRKRKISPVPPTLTPLVTKTKRKRCHSDSEDSDSQPKPKHKRQKTGEHDGASKNSNSIRFNLDTLSSSSDEEKVVGKRDAFHVFPGDRHLFDESSDVTSSHSGNESDCVSSTDEDLLKHKSGIDLYTTLRKRWQHKKEYFSLRYTVCFCYLGLLYTHQNVFLSDLTRWTRLHKLPYHNLVGLLPRSFCTGHNVRSLIAVQPLVTENIYNTARSIYTFLPLPPIPSRDPAPLCHALLDRLCLPTYLHRMMDKTLNCIHKPEFESCFYGPPRRFDGECLAMVVMLLRVLYKLDDIHEFEMIRLVAADAQSGPSKEKQAVYGPDSVNESVYLWEDWVVLYSREKLHTLRDGIPLNARELQYVTDYSNYLEFCKIEVFSKCRPTPRRLPLYNPTFVAKIADTFKQLRLKFEESKTAGESSSRQEGYDDILTDVDNKEENIETSFHPRCVSLQALLGDPQAGWKLYEQLQQSAKTYKLFGVQLSHSMQFLLDTCVELIDIHVEELYSSLLLVEHMFINITYLLLGHIDSVLRKDFYLKPVPSSRNYK